MIPLKDCKHGFVYRIHSRNLSIGVFNLEASGFVGIREKAGREYLFTEYHRDTGAPFGTVSPEAMIEECPLKDLRTALDTECWECRKPVKFVKKSPDDRIGDWIHEGQTECRKPSPSAPMNEKLFDYLKGLEKRKD